MATRTLSRMAESLGAGAVMVTPSREPVPGEDRVFEYFRQAVQGISIPVVVQDHPASTEVHMSVELMLRIVREIPGSRASRRRPPHTGENRRADPGDDESQGAHPDRTGGPLRPVRPRMREQRLHDRLRLPRSPDRLVRAVRENGRAMRGISTGGFFP